MTKKHLLIDEYPLLVLPSLATCIGLNEAIALQQVHYWTENPKGGVELDGYKWVYNTYEAWQNDNFPFWSVRTVIRVFTNLENMELVVSRQLASYDRKKYYRVHYDNLASWIETGCHNADLQDGKMDNDKMASSLTETTTENTRKEEKDSLLQTISESAFSIFPDIQIWWNVRHILERGDVSITGEVDKKPSLEDPMQIVIRGLSEKPKGGQFTLAQIWEDRFTKSFERVGFAVEFQP